MLPEGYTTVIFSGELAEKLTQIMARYDRFSIVEAIEYGVNTTLVQEDKVTILELIHLLSERAEKLN